MRLNTYVCICFSIFCLKKNNQIKEHPKMAYLDLAANAAMRSRRALRACFWLFLRTRRVFTRRGSQLPRLELFMHRGSGRLIPLRWFLRDWLWLVWFLDLAIFLGVFLRSSKRQKRERRETQREGKAVCPLCAK
ncbi:large subunit ribosomal protein L29e [Strigomonas culicis]|uniref:Large subunit ribosomal protein L29e n=1 Tax=Strigomonas culicis TaxID=28005 RepID=S9W8Y3_9TRYP|nr:large subunit ribosomal protein L29e [Strigomonas culicis]|eukprot:EPY32310.1 large subunit ribosomal protein L29e [Strigomonas culicis]